ncbi:MAG: hypothetical protein IJN31_08700, partial [Peptococcaceae bacterium]|nr:hypothetical protein [Peptococcaceae bacterium]
MYYLVLLLAVLMFTAQFAFTNIYGERVRQSVHQTLVMLLLTGILGAVMYWVIGGFQVAFSSA